MADVARAAMAEGAAAAAAAAAGADNQYGAQIWRRTRGGYCSVSVRAAQVRTGRRGLAATGDRVHL